MLEFTDPNLDDLVHLESIEQVTIRDDTQRIAWYLDLFLQLQELALSLDESDALLDKLIGEMPSSANSTVSAEKEDQ